MTTTSAGERFQQFLDNLTVRLAGAPGVLGLVLLGSTADRGRVDEWSDHDFWVITEDERAEPLRQGLDWLPDAASIVLSARETEHGLKVVYRDGHVLEFAVATISDLAVFTTNGYEVAFDAGGVNDAMRRMLSAAEGAIAPPSDDRDIRLFLGNLLIAVGRHRRGEVLAAGQQVRSQALAQLLVVLRHRVPADGRQRLDNLDVFRRLEQVYPQLARRLGSALEADPESAARELLAIAEDELAAGWDGWPSDAVAVVRRRLGW